MRTRLASALALLALTVGGLVALVPQHTAVAADPTRYGEAQMPADSYPVRETWLYLEHWAGTIPERPIVQVDTEHANEKGFYFAVKNPTIPSNERQINWVFRPWGVDCDMTQYYNLVFNPWMNSYSCAADPDAFEAYVPGYQQKLAECQAAQGQPWKWTEAWNNWNCSNYNVSWDEIQIGWQGTQSTRCAPWETVAQCNDTSWNTKTATTWWVPQPDPCVGVRSDVNKFGTTAKGFRTTDADVNTDVPDCDGSALAPNCTSAQSASPACGGPIVPVTPDPTPTPTPTPTATPTPQPDSHTETATVTVSHPVTSTATVTESTTAKVKRKKVTVSVTRKVDGRRVTKSASRTIRTRGAGSAEVTRTHTDHYSGTGTASCTRPSQDEALACATAEAESLARTDAETRFSAVVSERALAFATAEARDRAKQAAREDARAQPVTRAMVRKAKRQARRVAISLF